MTDAAQPKRLFALRVTYIRTHSAPDFASYYMHIPDTFRSVWIIVFPAGNVNSIAEQFTNCFYFHGGE